MGICPLQTFLTKTEEDNISYHELDICLYFNPQRKETIMADEDVGFVDYFKICWQWKWIIFVITACFVALAVIFAYTQPPQFETTFTLMIFQTKTYNPGEEKSRYIMMKNYPAMATNHTTLQQLVTKYKLDEEPYNMRPQDLAKKIEAKVNKDSHLIEVTVTFYEKQLTFDIARDVADMTIKLNNSLKSKEIEQSLAFLKDEVKESHRKYLIVEKEYREFISQASLKQLQIELDSQARVKKEFDKLYALALVDLEKNRNMLAALEEKKKKLSVKVTETNSLVNDSQYQQTLSKLSQSDLTALLNLKMDKDIMNPVYQKLEIIQLDLIAEVGGLERYVVALKEAVRKSEQLMKRLEADLTARTVERDFRKRDYTLAQVAYSKVFERYEDARVLISSRTNDIVILDEPFFPKKPISSKLIVLVFVALVLGFFVSLTATFLGESFKQIRASSQKS